MANDQVNPAIERTIQQLVNEQRNAAKIVSELGNKLSSKGVEDLTKTLKELLKNLKLVDGEYINQIKTFKGVTKVISELEDQHQKAIEIIGDEQKLQKHFNKEKGFEAKAASKLAKELTSQRLQEIGINEELFKILMKNIPALRAYAESTNKNVSRFDRLGATVEHVKDALNSQIAYYAEVGTALTMMKRGVSQGLEELLLFTNKGLLGATGALQWMSLTMGISAKTFEEIINKNRLLVNALGGGVEGIGKFKEKLNKIEKDLIFLGPDWSKAAARLVETTNNMGVAITDSGFDDELNSTTKQFRKFNEMFGDTFDEYSNLLDTITNEAGMREKLNSLSSVEARLEREHIKAQVETLKNMGLSNTQIVEFNSKISQLYDPNKNTIEQRFKEAAYTQIAVRGIKQKLTGGTAEQQKMAGEIDDGLLQQYVDAIRQGGQAPSNFLRDNPKFARAISKGETTVMNDPNLAGKYQGAVQGIQYATSEAGSSFATLRELGKPAVTARAQGKDTTEMTPEQRAKMAEKNQEAAHPIWKPPEWFQKVLDLLPQGLKDFLTQLGITTEGIKLDVLLGNVQKWIGMFDNALGKILAGIVLLILNPFKILGNILGLMGRAFGGLGSVLSKILGGAGGEAAAAAAGAEAATAGEGAAVAGAAAAGFAVPAATVAVGAAAALYSPNTSEPTDKMHDELQKKFDKPSGVSGGRLSVGKIRGLTSATSDQASQVMTAPSTPTASGSNEISSVVSSGSGFLVVRRPDGTVEKITGSRSWRNNNPGNLEYNAYTQGLGAIGSDGRFAVFPTLEAGQNAQSKLLFQGQNYKDLSLTDAIARYAPSSENNTGAYQSSILAAVGGQNKPMSQYTASEQQAIMAAMKQHEGFSVGTASPFNVPFSSSNTAVSANTGAGVELPGLSTQAPASAAPGEKVSLDDTNSELKKQTQLLAAIVGNTSSGKIRAAPENYQVDPSTSMNAIGT